MEMNVEIMKTKHPSIEQVKPPMNKTLQTLYNQRYMLLMLLPTLVVLGVFVYRPVQFWVVAFKDFRVGRTTIWEADWHGFTAFREFFMDTGDAWPIFRNTLSINLSSLFINLTVAMVFAILLSEIRSSKVKSVVQTFSLLPFFVSWVITYAFFQVFFSVNTGLFNTFLMRMGLIDHGINLLGGPEYSLRLMIMANLWKSLGFNAVIFLATIAGIDQEQYEAANIDGAGRFAKIRHITLPSLMGTLSILLILNSGWLLNSNFEQFFQFTNPTNRPTMEVFDMYVYRFGLQLARFPYATAVGILRTIFSLVMLILTNSLYKKLTGNSIF